MRKEDQFFCYYFNYHIQVLQKAPPAIISTDKYSVPVCVVGCRDNNHD